MLLDMWPLAVGGNGLYTGAMQDRSGRVGATLMQELLFRRPDGSWPIPPPPPPG